MDMTIILLQFLVPFCFLQSCLSVDVIQNPKLQLAYPKDNISFNCIHEESSFTYKYWYQQEKGKELFLIGRAYKTEKAEFEKKFINKGMTIESDRAMESTLTISQISSEDSAVYYCASSIDSSGGAKLEFGGGTFLSILENGQVQSLPKVKIFGPNKQEFKHHNLISLVCVASGFYPEHVRLNWTINGIPRNGLYQNVASKKENDTSFSTSKRLTLTRSEYFNPENEFKCEASFIGNDSGVSYVVRGGQDCGVSKESYTMYINQGKISYIMVLFKSGLYALIVLAIIWRRKVHSGSC